MRPSSSAQRRMLVLEGKHIVVTGAGRGIGRAIAIACAREGATVGLAYFASADGARSAATEIGDKFGRKTVLLPFDVRDPEAVARAIETFREQAGEIDGWVNNAGI